SPAPQWTVFLILPDLQHGIRTNVAGGPSRCSEAIQRSDLLDEGCVDAVILRGAAGSASPCRGVAPAAKPLATKPVMPVHRSAEAARNRAIQMNKASARFACHRWISTVRAASVQS